MVAVIKIEEFSNPANNIIFPITPSEIPESADATTKTFNIIGKGQHSFPDGRNERKFSVQGYFPGQGRWSPFGFRAHDNLPHIHDWRHPDDIVSQVKIWLDIKAKLRYVVDTRAGQMTVPVYLSKYSFTRRGPAGDIYYALDLTEWRTLSVITNDGSSSAGGPDSGSADTSDSSAGDQGNEEDPTPTSYTVQPGDNLTFIAKRFLGDGGRWPEIYDANRDTIGDNPNMISPGMELLIPGGTIADPNQDGYAPMGIDSTVGSDVEG